MSKGKTAEEEARDYVSRVFCIIFESTEPKYDEYEDDSQRISEITAQLDTLVNASIAREQQSVSDEKFSAQFKEEARLLELLYQGFDEYDEDDFGIFCKFYQPSDENDPVIALELVENFEGI